MKCVDVGGLFSLLLPSDAVCALDGEGRVLTVSCEEPRLSVSVFIETDAPLGADRMGVCSRHLEQHVREEIGPPFETSVEEVSGETWSGYQAVTALGNERFRVNRCVASRHQDVLLRLESEISRDVAEAVVEMLEELVFPE